MPICPNQGHAMDPTSIPQISDVCHSPQTGKGGFITSSVDFSDGQSSLVSATVRQSEIVLSIFKACLNTMKARYGKSNILTEKRNVAIIKIWKKASVGVSLYAGLPLVSAC